MLRSVVGRPLCSLPSSSPGHLSRSPRAATRLTVWPPQVCVRDRSPKWLLSHCHPPRPPRPVVLSLSLRGPPGIAIIIINIFQAGFPGSRSGCCPLHRSERVWGVSAASPELGPCFPSSLDLLSCDSVSPPIKGKVVTRTPWGSGKAVGFRPAPTDQENPDRRGAC